MEKKRTEELMIEIVQMYKEKPAPFPFDDCRFVLEGAEDKFEGFIPDLDLWSLDIAGYCRWGAEILRWPQEKLTEAQSRIALGFFEKHPEYRVIQRFIAESDTPNLYEYLGAYERMRRKLIDVISNK